MTHLYTDTWESTKPINWQVEDTGGQTCDRMWWIMSEGVQNVKETKSIHNPPGHHCNPYSPYPKPCLLRQSPLILLLNCQFHRDMTWYSLSPTTTVPKQLYSSHARKVWWQKKLWGSSSNTYSHDLDSHWSSSATGTQNSPQNSSEDCVREQGQLKISQWPIIPKWMGNRSALISDLSSTCDFGSTNDKITGMRICLSQNLCITTGQMKPRESPLSSHYMGSICMLIGRISHPQYHR